MEASSTQWSSSLDKREAQRVRGHMQKTKQTVNPPSSPIGEGEFGHQEKRETAWESLGVRRSGRQLGMEPTGGKADRERTGEKQPQTLNNNKIKITWLQKSSIGGQM